MTITDNKNLRRYTMSTVMKATEAGIITFDETRANVGIGYNSGGMVNNGYDTIIERLYKTI